MWTLREVSAQSQSLLECLSECLSSQNTHAEAVGLHLELHVFTVNLIFIYLSSTKKRTMTGKPRTQLAFYLSSQLMLPPSSSPHHHPFVFSFLIKIYPTTVQRAPTLLHVHITLRTWHICLQCLPFSLPPSS